MKKRFALALIVAGTIAAGCSSDDDGDDPVVDTTGETDTSSTIDTGGDTEDGTGDVNETVTDGPAEDAGPVELAVAGDPQYSNFYTLIDAIFGGETLDARQTPEEAWTFLVPTNAAFQAAGAGSTPDDQKSFLLRRHVITDGNLTTADLAALSEVVTNTGDSYPITGDASSLAIGGVNILEVIAENGNTIVYGVDGVLQDTLGN